ncbi:hypothetical protein U1Q18_028458 [Sarracenia purpurea var. burkii]
MSFSDPPPPSPFMPPPFPGGDGGGGFWPQLPISDEDLDQNTQFDYPPPLKRRRGFGNNQPNGAHFPPPVHPRINTPANPPPASKGTGHIFYKTRMCLKFTEGNCRNGEHCTFAHGTDELRDPPPNWQEIVAAREKDRGTGIWYDDQRFIQKMKICKKFLNGEECPYGDKCNFFHRDPREGTIIGAGNFLQKDHRESSAISIGTMGPEIGPRNGSDILEANKNINPNPSPSSNPNPNPTADSLRFIKSTYWRTKLCSKWETTGLCPFGDRCHFAHGLSELQAPGGRIEAEAVNAFINPTKHVSVPGNDVPLSKAVINAAAKEDGDGMKFFSKWKGTKKINRIYADWIDDLTPPKSLPSQAESSVYI